MKSMLFIAVLYFFSTVAYADDLAIDKKVYKISKGDWLCVSYYDVELAYVLVSQGDQKAFDNMFKSKRCVVFQSDAEAYQMDVIGAYAQFRFKGTTTTGWG